MWYINKQFVFFFLRSFLYGKIKILYIHGDDQKFLVSWKVFLAVINDQTC